MKRIIYAITLLIAVIIILPLLIVKGCSSGTGNKLSNAQKGGLKVKVYITSQNIVKEMSLEEYVKGVVAAEMPAEFEIEALKAQAVAARTYCYARLNRLYIPKENPHDGADICTDPAHCQAWISKEAAMKKWKFIYAYKYWSKIESAVKQTEGTILTYNGTIINPVFHSNSGGRTENAEDVWEGGAVAYLRSVESEGEELGGEFKSEVPIKTKDFVAKLKEQYPEIELDEKNLISQVKILDYTDGGRIKTINIGNIALKGTDLRKVFSLKSANFTIDEGENDTIKIITFGNGHGVGMSQRGANYLAKTGKNFEEILKHYYSGVGLNWIR